MKYGDSIIHVKKDEGKIGMVWSDEKRINHGKVVNNLKEGLKLLSQMIKEQKTLINFCFLYGDFGIRLPTEQVENDPLLSSLSSEKGVTLIIKHKE